MLHTGYPRQGQDVLLLAHDAAPGQVFPGSVARTEPLSLRMVGVTPPLRRGAPVSVLYRLEGMHHKLQCEVAEWVVRGDAVVCEVKVLGQENLERRRSERLPAADAPCSLSFVAGLEGGMEVGSRDARIVDISLHGACVTADLAPTVGCLYHLTVPMADEPSIRALTVCTRAPEPGLFALEFVDLIGESAGTLRRFLLRLRQAAA